MTDSSDPRTTVPQVVQLQGAPDWRAIDFISDLHLQPSEPQTVEAWRSYLARSTADAIFILGDLFEVWVGDDALDEPGSFEAECAAVLREAVQQRPLFFMVGNRDFLAGDEFLRRSGMTGLTPLCCGGQAAASCSAMAMHCVWTMWITSTGCFAPAAWQQQLLAQPLAVRRAIGKSARSESEQRKQSGAPYADADA